MSSTDRAYTQTRIKFRVIISRFFIIVLLSMAPWLQLRTYVASYNRCQIGYVRKYATCSYCRLIFVDKRHTMHEIH